MSKSNVSVGDFVACVCSDCKGKVFKVHELREKTNSVYTLDDLGRPITMTAMYLQKLTDLEVAAHLLGGKV